MNLKFAKFLILLLLISTSCLYSSFISDKIDQIKNSDYILYGEGKAEFSKQADTSALNDLLSQISVSVKSEFEEIIVESGNTVEDYTSRAINTYSNVTLNQAKRLIDEETYAPKVYVLRYIELEDMQTIFRERQNKIITLVKEGLMAEEELRIADALRNYYWAFRLLRTHPDNQKIKFAFDDRGELILYQAFENRILRIFSLLHFKIKHVKEYSEEDYKEYYLDITFGPDYKPVQNLTFSYHNGFEYSKNQNIKDGLGIAELHGEASRALKKLKINIEYEFYGHISDKEIKQVFDEVTPFYFKEKLSSYLITYCYEMTYLIKNHLDYLLQVGIYCNTYKNNKI